MKKPKSKKQNLQALAQYMRPLAEQSHQPKQFNLSQQQGEVKK